MAKHPTHQTWTVLPHGPIEKLEHDLWRVEGTVPGMLLKRVMTIARLDSGELVLLNVIALDDGAMHEIEAFGKPSVILVPNGWHRLDAKVFADRYPQARVCSLPPARSQRWAKLCAPTGRSRTFRQIRT